MLKRNKRKELLSVVVPAYKQEKTIVKDLANINFVLQNGLSEKYDYELICVVDGKIDKTFQKASKLKLPKLNVVGYDVNRGKGYAVRYGMKLAKGDLVSFLDSGMDISPKGIVMLISHMEWYDADIIVGSKRHPVSRVNYPLARKMLSVGYHFGVKLLFSLPLTDTQSGLKIFKRKVIDVILSKLTVDRYAIDIEMLALAKYFGFDRIYEAPIEVVFDKKTSKIKWLGGNSGLKMMFDSIYIFYKLKVAKVYGKK